VTFLDSAAQRINAQGIADPYREARLLLAHCLGTTYETVFFDPPHALPLEMQRAFESLLARRLADEPLSKIKEMREFWGQSFIVTADTLDPRPDSETLIEAVLDYFPDRDRAYRILDLGTGTGCLLVSLLKEYPKATGIGVDICEKALRVASRNAANLLQPERYQFIRGDWATGLSGTFDIIVSNPPYIAIGETLPKAVSHYDPPQALYAGVDGLQVYRQLLPDLKKLCYSKTYLFFEVGYAQYDAVKIIINECSGRSFPCKIDLQGYPRVAIFAYLI
jgi:release factor glutamine methyltransferase